MSKVSYLVEWSINDGELENFKSMAENAIATVQANEPDTLTYLWYLSEDGKKCLLLETHASDANILVHLGTVGPILPDIMAIAPITRFELMGSVSDEVRAAMDAVGLNIKYLPQIGGFER